jgi:hypothetical protein
MAINDYKSVKVFSATKMQDREVLGEKVTDWLSRNRELTVVDTVISQSSDSEFHCLSIVLFLTK